MFQIHKPTETFGYVVDVYTFCSQWAVSVLQTFYRWLTTAIIRISNHSLLTVTPIGPSGIFTHSTRCARLIRTIIYQLTCMSWFSSVARLTRTNLKNDK